jgi:hypothetical protein
MKVGTITPQEFQSGTNRLRKNTSRDRLMKSAEGALRRYSASLENLARKRLELLIPWWQTKFPTRQLRIIFGNGAYSASVDGRHLYICEGLPTEIRHAKYEYRRFDVPDSCFDEMISALEDVETITDDYRGATPEDFVIEPIKQRRKRELAKKDRRTETG